MITKPFALSCEPVEQSKCECGSTSSQRMVSFYCALALYGTHSVPYHDYFFSPDWAAKLGDPIMRYAGIVLFIGAAIIIVSSFGKIIEVGLSSILAFAGLTLIALMTGHCLGGSDEAKRTSLAVSCATRHIGLALVLAAGMKGHNTFPLIATYLFASTLVSIPYIRWRKKVASQLIQEVVQ